MLHRTPNTDNNIKFPKTKYTLILTNIQCNPSAFTLTANISRRVISCLVEFQSIFCCWFYSVIDVSHSAPLQIYTISIFPVQSDRSFPIKFNGNFPSHVVAHVNRIVNDFHFFNGSLSRCWICFRILTSA